MRLIEFLRANRNENPEVELTPRPHRRVATAPSTSVTEEATVLTLEDLTDEELAKAEEFFGRAKPAEETTVDEPQTGAEEPSLDTLRVRRI